MKRLATWSLKIALAILYCLACWLLAGAMAGAAEHPAVCRVRVSDGGNVSSLGSGVYVQPGVDDAGKATGLVLTNHHVIRDCRGGITVTFPDGFRSGARLLGSDPRKDLAALVCWKPNATPVPIAASPPQPGARLWIIGYGGSPTSGYLEQVGQARYEFVGDILTVSGAQARQGDSGGPILDSNGCLAGVLDACGSGFTIGANTTATRTFLAQYSPKLAETQCQGGQCYSGYGPPAYTLPPRPTAPPAPVYQPPPRPPVVTTPPQVAGCPCAAKWEALAEKEREILLLIQSIQKQQGPAGPAGPAGANGVSPVLDYDALAAEVVKKLPPVRVEWETLAGEKLTQSKPLGEVLKFKELPVKVTVGAK